MKQPIQALLKLSTGLSFFWEDSPKRPTIGRRRNSPLTFGSTGRTPVPSPTLAMRSLSGGQVGQRPPRQRIGGNSPQFVSNALNGKSLLRFDGSDDRMEFTGGFVPGDFVVLFKRTANNARCNRDNWHFSWMDW